MFDLGFGFFGGGEIFCLFAFLNKEFCCCSRTLVYDMKQNLSSALGKAGFDKDSDWKEFWEKSLKGTSQHFPDASCVPHWRVTVI